MKTTITIILLIVTALYAAGLHIETNPFRIRFESWLTLLGWVVIAVGVSLITAGQYEKGLKRGRDITIEILEEFANEKQQNNERNQIPRQTPRQWGVATWFFNPKDRPHRNF